MNKPQLYNVELTDGVKNNEAYANALISIYHIPKEVAADVIDDVNHGRKTVIATVPLDIAKTVSDVFINTCRENGFSSKINLALSGKYSD